MDRHAPLPVVLRHLLVLLCLFRAIESGADDVFELVSRLSSAFSLVEKFLMVD